MSKFLYNEVAAQMSADGNFMIKVDGQVFKTPNGETVVGNGMLIKALAEELKTQKTELNFHDMPLTRYVFTAFDRVRGRRDSVINEIVRYVETDLLCYRVSSPQELVKKQDKLWQPLVDWSKDKYGIGLITSVGTLSILQDPATLKKVHQIIKLMNNFRLTGMYKAVALSGSAIVGLAILEGTLTVEKAWKIANLEESWQLERWGHDTELLERLTISKKEFADLGHFLSLIKL